ncbi:MAG: putative transcriptional regulator with domain [Rhodocyclaceae bacterium]|nr:putative transcriptional regulator with domain [Rhodocyclaceae bacterium]
MTPDRLERLLANLRALPNETEWVEFKENRAEHDDIGQYISALSNSARLKGQPFGYMVWGIHNDTHAVVGTSFSPGSAKQGNEELEHWLVRMLAPRQDIRFHTFTSGGQKVVILEIPAALHTPVRFSGSEFIRVGSLKKLLKDYPEKERELWQILGAAPFEAGIAKADLDADEALLLLEYTKYFELTRQPLPSTKEGILARLKADSLIAESPQGWAITNLGAILFARNLENFRNLARKALRVVQYKGTNRIQSLREHPDLAKGYALVFEAAISYIDNLLPASERISQGLRQVEKPFPELAIRELIANALIHQDFLPTGTGPMVELFDDRIEITNPGHPLVDTLRMMDEPPRSRNEALAALMRRMGMCEERGSGIDKVVSVVESAQLPAPAFILKEQSMLVTLYSRQALKDMSPNDRIRACYQHACLKHLSNDAMTNTSLRERFNISEGNSAQASRIIAETTKAELIKQSDPGNKSRKLMKYVPFWA